MNSFWNNYKGFCSITSYYLQPSYTILKWTWQHLIVALYQMIIFSPLLKHFILILSLVNIVYIIKMNWQYLTLALYSNNYFFHSIGSHIHLPLASIIYVIKMNLFSLHYNTIYVIRMNLTSSDNSFISND